MALFGFRKKSKIIKASPIFVDESSYSKWLKEQAEMKGLVASKKIKWPSELGEEHPFDFAQTESIYKKFGFVTGMIDKYVDFMISGFFVKSKNKKALKIIEDWMRDVVFDSILRIWVKEGLNKGNGFLELGGKEDEVPKGLKILDAKWMYVERDNKGKIDGYNQYAKAMSSRAWSDIKEDIIPFKPYQIAHLTFNKVGDCAYGLGKIYSALNLIDNLLGNIKQFHKIIKRKAGTPYHVKCGNLEKEIRYTPEELQGMASKFEYLNEKTEWVTGDDVEIKAIDFGDIGGKFAEIMELDMNLLYGAFQVPAVLMGIARIPEGLAKVQMDAFRMSVTSMQAEVEKVIEENIFKRILRAHKIEAHVEFEWGQPSQEERNEQIKILTELLKAPLSLEMANIVQRDVALIMGHTEEETKDIDQEKEDELDAPQPKVPGQQDQKPLPKDKEEILKRERFYLIKDNACPHCIENLKWDYSLREWLNFDYVKYKTAISLFLTNFKFPELKDSLNASQIENLRSSLKRGFDEEKSVRQIAKDIEKRVSPPPLVKIGKDGKERIIVPMGVRSINIARTEITRAANQGSLINYRQNNIKEVSWVASFGPRTCDICEDLNGTIMNAANPTYVPPKHSLCRCSLIPIIR